MAARTRSLALLAVLVTALLAGADSAAAHHLTCNGQATTIDGTTGDDDLVGTAGADVVQLLEGQDRFVGGSGNDVICGGDGVDTLDGEADDDVVDAGPGNDGCLCIGGGLPAGAHGGAGTDTIRGGDGNDTVTGGPGDDDIDGGPGTEVLDFLSATGPVTVNLADGTASGPQTGNDSVADIENVTGSNFSDHITGDDDPNVIQSAQGDDDVFGGGGNDHLDAHHGEDEVHGGPGDDIVRGFQDDDELFGDAGKDNLDGFTGNDTLDGGADDDGLTFDEGDDDVEGGAGVDTMTVSGTGPVVVDLGAGTSAGSAAGAIPSSGADSIGGVENIEGSSYDDELTGNGDPNRLVGQAGDDTIDGAGGADTLVGYCGKDELDGGPDDDVLDPEVDFSFSPPLLAFCPWTDDEVDGGAGSDTVTYADHFGGPMDVDLAAGTATGEGADQLTSIENAIGSGVADTLDGTAAANRLDGGFGDDTIDGRAGADRMDGGDDNDICRRDVAADELISCETPVDEPAPSTETPPTTDPPAGPAPPSSPPPAPPAPPAPGGSVGSGGSTSPPVVRGAAPAFSALVTLPSARRCVSRRRLRIRLRVPRGAVVRSARVDVNGRRVRVVRGKRLTAPIDLRGLPRGRFTVRITVTLADGRTVRGTRRYRTCTARSRAR